LPFGANIAEPTIVLSCVGYTNALTRLYDYTATRLIVPTVSTINPNARASSAPTV